MDATPPPATTKPKPYSTGPLPGGELPDVGKLLSETFAELGDNMGPYVLAGVGHFLVMMPVAFVLVFVVYAAIFGGMFGTAVIGSVLAAMVAEIDRSLGDLVLGLATVLTIVVPFVLLFAVIALAGAMIAPLHASLYRSIAQHQRGEKPLDLMSTFTSAHTGVVPVMVVSLIVSSLAVVLLMFCYVPALLVPILLPFAVSLVALGGLGPIDALRKAWSHSTRNLSWYVMFGLITFAGGMVAAYVPVIGAVFMAAFHVRAYRHLFGDGEPVVSA